MTVQASLLVSDDLLIALNGKWTIVGVYTGDIVVPSGGLVVPQMVFIFMVRVGVGELFERLEVEVLFPKEAEPRRQVPPLMIDQTAIPKGRKQISLKWPFLISQPTLNPGRIQAKLIHDKGEIEVPGPWVVTSNP
ncbi:MAG: hypothetical protein ACLPX9_19690 [Rhodomicrobium sp.]